MRYTTAILTSAFALSLAACSQDSPTVSQRIDNATANSSTTQGISSTISTSDFERHAAQQPIPVMVRGGALGLDRPALERKVTSDMQGSTWGPKAHFMPAYQQTMPSQGHEFSIVMMVNGPQQLTGADLCAASVPQSVKQPVTTPPKATPMKKGDVRVLSALCHYDQTVNQVEARATSIAGVNDPKFDNLIVTAANQLTQPQPGLDRPASPGQEQ